LLSYVTEERQSVYAQKYITYIRNVFKLIMNVVCPNPNCHMQYSA